MLSTFLRRTVTASLVAVAIPLAASLHASQEVLYYEDRADIPERYTWDLSLYYEDAAAWDKAFAELEALVPGNLRYKGKVGESPASLAAALEDMFEISSQLGPLPG